MFTLLLRLKRRIKRLLKVQTESRQTQTATVRSRTTKILMLVLTGVAIGIIYPGDVLYEPLDMPLRGEFAPEEIRAPFQITIYKSDQEVRRAQDSIRQLLPYVVDRDTLALAESITGLRRFVHTADSLRALDQGKRVDSIAAHVELLSKRFPLLGQNTITRALTDSLDLRKAAARLEMIYRNQIYTVGVLNQRSELPATQSPSIIVRTGDKENVYPRGRVLDMALANAKLSTALNLLAATESIDVDFHYHLGRTFIRPNLLVNVGEYMRRLNEELELLSNVKEVVNKGEIIVHARQKVTDRQEEVLRELANYQRNQAADQGWWIVFLPALARVLLVLAAFTALYIFLYFFRRDIYRSNPRLLALLLVFGLQMFLIYLSGLLDLNSIYIYPVAVLPILVTILFDAEVGIVSTIVLALLLGILHRFSFTLVLLTTVVGFVGCMTSREVRKRSHFYRIMFNVILAYLLVILVVENLKLTPNDEILTEMIYGLLIGVLSSLMSMGILPFFESLFGLTTDITLLELSDLNHPLLKRLAIEAPGTYHHSISVGNLCETAAEAIGGNSLLARVGAYYHDIGKIEIPEYFVENQFSVRSRHDSLTPSMSSLILASHVKKGRKLGEEADIPDEVLNFIEEHHGTMVMSYFYHRAKEQEGGEVDVNKFRYPGPKPQIRETGIAMLADAVEAASRTLEDPKPARIDSLIQRIINDRFQSGELDECPLTLRDLARIKEAFAQVLIAAFHHRVKYPSEREAPAS